MKVEMSGSRSLVVEEPFRKALVSAKHRSTPANQRPPDPVWPCNLTNPFVLKPHLFCSSNPTESSTPDEDELRHGLSPTPERFPRLARRIYLAIGRCRPRPLEQLAVKARRHQPSRASI